MTRQQTRPYHRLIVLGLALFAFGMSALISRTVFERLPHLEDEMAYLFQARILARGQFVIETPQPERAYWQPFVIDQNGTRFGKYTPGWPALLALGVIMGQEWFVNAALAALTVALVFRLGTALFNPDTGVIAAALTAFSPMALLLNSSLMGHTAALFAATLFIYAYLRLERTRRLRWGWAAGIALGLLVADRPLTAIAVAIPFIAWSVVRLLRALAARRRDVLLPTLRPLAALSAVALAISLIVPLYNARAVGSPVANLYRLVWDYDRVGFGPGYGRNGHTLEKGVRHARFDLSLTAADLFGMQLEPMRDATGALRYELYDHFVNQADYYPATGVSWILPLAGLIALFGRRSWHAALWFALGLIILALPFALQNGDLSRDPRVSWIVVIGLLGWLCAPLLLLRGEMAWRWLLVCVPLSLVIVQLAYWIGSQRYSTRYYYEGLTAVALISALPLAWLAGRARLRPLVYGGVAALLVYSLFAYSVPRLGALYGFNLINRSLVDAVEARREGDRPVLVIINGTDVRWRAYGSLMAQTSPFLDSPIVAARASTAAERAAILARFPDRQVIEMEGFENAAWFRGEPAG